MLLCVSLGRSGCVPVILGLYTAGEVGGEHVEEGLAVVAVEALRVVGGVVA